MKRIAAYLIIAFACLTACKVKTIYVPVETKTVITETVRDTIVDVRIEYIRDSVITPDTISFLSNIYAYSSAEWRNGLLHHVLSTCPDALIPVNIKYIDRLRIDSIPAPYPVEVPVYVENPLSWWQKARIKLGEVLLIIIGIGIAYLAWKLIKK